MNPLVRENADSEVLCQVIGSVGHITLNRPHALNALNLNMIRDIHGALEPWKNDDTIDRVIITGAGEKAFCAGGDVKAVYDAKAAGHIDTVGDAFFREEYTLNHLIHEYPKPYIALVHGIAMGGGLGVSINGETRVIADNTVLAMPETGLGLFTDVGGTEFLGRAGAYGIYLGLTGARFTAEDALYMGMATHIVSHESFQSVYDEIIAGCDVDMVCERYFADPGPGFLEQHHDWIHQHFSHLTLSDVLASLKNDENELSQKTYGQLMKKSPTSLAVVFQQLKGYEKSWTFAEVMKREFRLSQHFMQGGDFFEGVRALLIDKDKNPQWNPDQNSRVSKGDVERYFESLGERELIL